MQPRSLLALALPFALVVLLFVVFSPAWGPALTPPKEAPGGTTSSTPMTQASLEALIRRVAENVQGDPGAIQFEIAGVTLLCISDVDFDRMRLIAPITATEHITQEHTRHMLEANFHSALDARYATSDGIVYAAFVHPLSLLGEAELASAIQQVATLASTFGTHYTSGVLRYGGEREQL